ncbi:MULTISPECIES: hypothetical protein [Enterobacteriaceae]|uniref:hypothetical protein n=1 Tax=Enterobacteriaceae TaxID=543 RepID=UPI0011E49470|nr:MULTISPECIES: hypothetical protein [Enterobacteriaceae]MBJ4956418.1 hypothetical protein [Salmonella enterica subsp. enterica serovar Goldcoast]HCM9425675.1 hypothetical protein [Enterobacter hormaechei subsp. xiangfangensis]EKW1516341.1 hypothetical protein [Citrobacter freundii]EKW7468333.1 hypothetical protein [Citrobacter freundii]MBA7867657.1 hypothetical protein [Enterobacter hormaechei]
MTILSLFLDKAGLVFSALALLVSILSYRNSREIKIKNNSNSLYRFKIETLEKARESEIAFQDIYDKVTSFVKALENNTEVSNDAKLVVLNELREQRDTFFRQCVLDSKAACSYIIDNFDSMSESKFIEYHRVFTSELDRLKANNKRLDERFANLLDGMKFK